MNYPVWVIPAINGGLLVAIIAVVHVFVAHFAVGGGLFLVLAEMKGYREKSPIILDYVKGHTKFFMLLTMVFGSLTGVGIWFIISVVSPAATSTLIHSFVFGWATEWVFFVGEIVAIFVYFYTFGSMEKQKHLVIGWLYFIFAWLSLFIINGVITMMLTPGKWLETQSFWDGFFNPSSFPSLVFRTAIALMLAGLFGFLTSTRIRDDIIREKMIRFCVLFLVPPVLILIGSGYWYLSTLHPFSRELVAGASQELIPFVKLALHTIPILILGGLFMSIKMPRNLKTIIAYVLLVIGFLDLSAFEWIREGARKPFIIQDFMYSNNIKVTDLRKVQKEGFLSSAKWVQTRKVTEDNPLAGKELFNHLCLPCHSVGGVMNNVVPLVEKYNEFGLDSFLNGMGKINKYMPEFPGTSLERKTLADYISFHILDNKPMVEEVPIFPKLTNPVSEFDPETSEYVLLAWNDLGMHCMTDNDHYWNILPPANNLFAQLILRGETPQVVTDGVTIRYQIEQGYRNPSDHVDFWEYAQILYGKEVKKNQGLSGNSLEGLMKPAPGTMAFHAELLPVVPYSDDGIFNPYPLFSIEAVDNGTGKVIAKTTTVAPVSTEMGCRNCHGGEWRFQGKTGISNQTSLDIARTHDRINKTDLVDRMKSGKPLICQSCHGDHALGVDGARAVLNLSAAMHGFHATLLTDRQGDVCGKCHPANPKGYTHCLRGIHSDLGLECNSCHGYLEDHALALLKMEKRYGKKSANILIENLQPRSVQTVDDVVGREPWIHEPDCLNCHINFEPPEVDSTYNQWTRSAKDLFRNRADTSGIMCEACHGSTHALYPASNPYQPDRDVLQPVQYQTNRYPIGANKNCILCHKQDMETEGHHPNSMAMMRN